MNSFIENRLWKIRTFRDKIISNKLTEYNLKIMMNWLFRNVDLPQNKNMQLGHFLTLGCMACIRCVCSYAIVANKGQCRDIKRPVLFKLFCHVEKKYGLLPLCIGNVFRVRVTHMQCWVLLLCLKLYNCIMY